MGFSKQEYWGWLPCPPPGDLSDPGTESTSLFFPALAGRFFTTRASPRRPSRRHWASPNWITELPCSYISSACNFTTKTLINTSLKICLNKKRSSKKPKSKADVLGMSSAWLNLVFPFSPVLPSLYCVNWNFEKIFLRVSLEIFPFKKKCHLLLWFLFFILKNMNFLKH